MSRLPPFVPEDLDAAQRDLYDAITGGPRAAGPQRLPLTDDTGRLTGPFNAMLAAPALGHALQQLGAAVRYETSLSARAREMATLAVAGQSNCEFEQYAHEPAARAAGVTPSQIETLRDGAMPLLPDETERSALELVFAMLRDEDVDDETYNTAVSTLGNQMIFELTTLVGYYATLALQLRVFRVSTPIVE